MDFDLRASTNCKRCSSVETRSWLNSEELGAGETVGFFLFLDRDAVSSRLETFAHARAIAPVDLANGIEVLADAVVAGAVVVDDGVLILVAAGLSAAAAGDSADNVELGNTNCR